LLFFQDPTHLVTKWRNRLLSSKAKLCLGNQSISVTHLHDIIENETYTKFDHGLTRSDINPKDRQNFSSCLKITSNDVLKILNHDAYTRGTLIYLRILKKIIMAYAERKTTITERKYSAGKNGKLGSNLQRLIQLKLQKQINANILLLKQHTCQSN
jgi:hypothetical protein